MYQNNFPDGLQTHTKFSADDTSLFSTIHNIATSADLFKQDPSKISEDIYISKTYTANTSSVPF